MAPARQLVANLDTMALITPVEPLCRQSAFALSPFCFRAQRFSLCTIVEFPFHSTFGFLDYSIFRLSVSFDQIWEIVLCGSIECSRSVKFGDSCPLRVFIAYLCKGQKNAPRSASPVIVCVATLHIGCLDLNLSNGFASPIRPGAFPVTPIQYPCGYHLKTLIYTYTKFQRKCASHGVNVCFVRCLFLRG
jgi:hypothetical protein